MSHLTTTFREQLAHIVSGHLPEFVRVEHPKFVEFLEAYYRFLDEDDVLLNSDEWIDIDTTLNAFLEKMRLQYSWDIPKSVLLENRRLIKIISQYYDTKGSEDGTKLFFRMMFNDEVDLFYPSEDILRASDGKWGRQAILKLDVSTNDPGNTTNPFDLTGRDITIEYLEFISGAGTILRSVPAMCLNVVRSINEEIYELEIDDDFAFDLDSIGVLGNTAYFQEDYTFDVLGDYSEASLTTDYDSGVYVHYADARYGSLSKQLVSGSAVVPGGGFRINDFYQLDEDGDLGDYFQDVYTDDPLGLYVFGDITNFATFRISELVDRDPVVGAIRRIRIINSGYRFADPGFTFLVSNSRPGFVQATLYFVTGFVFRTAGHFADSSGFLSDSNRLQDNYRYQTHSYVVRSAIPSSTWFSSYKNSGHPAGLKVFSDYSITGTEIFTFIGEAPDVELIPV